LLRVGSEPLMVSVIDSGIITFGKEINARSLKNEWALLELT